MKKLIFFLIFLPFGVMAQSKTTSDDMDVYISKKGIYELRFNKNDWQKTEGDVQWDAEFHDKYNLVNAYFIEYDYYLQDEKLKSTLKEQYAAYGKIKDLKIYKKRINNLDVSYFECKLKYQDYNYVYQGFVYNGKGGTVELHFGLQSEGAAALQPQIDAFCSGFSEIK